MSLMTPAKLGVSEYYADRGEWPTSNDEAGLATDTDINSKYVASVGVGDGGVITVTFAGAAPAHASIWGKTLVFTPTASGADRPVDWNCKLDGTLEAKYRPASCRP
ncbi:MAG: pilin [Xanthomonadaceae bacterium]|nr:pilin [Xanthomonadaceae bacterium]